MEIDQEIEQIAAELLSDFQKKRDFAKQPVKSVIIEIISKLHHLLFPGIFESVLSGGSAKNKLNLMLEEVSNDLAAQTRLALRYDLRYKDTEQDEIDKKAWEITRQFILKIPSIKDFLEKDIEAAYSGDPAAYSKAEIVISYPGIYATMVYRIAHELYLLSVPLIPRIMSEYAHSAHGHRHSSRSGYRQVFFYRPRHRYCHRRDRNYREQRKIVSGSNPWSLVHKRRTEHKGR